MGFREKLVKIVENPRFLEIISVIIVANSILLGLKTYPSLMESYGYILDVVDDLMVGVFVFELSVYMFVFGPKKCLTDPWYIFDSTVILITLVSFEPAFSSLRALRVLRVLRLVTIFPSLRKVIQSLLASLPGIASIGALMLIVFYVAAIISTHLFGDNFPKYFGNLQDSAFSLFQIMTAESWASNIARPVMEVHPYAWIFFVVFIVISSFIVLNLFVAVIVDAMQKDVAYQEGEEDKFAALHEIQQVVREIKQKLGD